MEKDSALFPSIPVSTVRAARALYGSGNLYLRLGDRLNHLVSKFHPGIVAGHLQEEKAALFTLLTIIQYVEKLTDTELADAIERRMDLRYALHLATPNHRVEPNSLCGFRTKVFTDLQYHTLFMEMFKRIYPELTPTAATEEPDSETILASICESEIRSSLREAMLSAMEALSASHFSWLRGIALPHWYQRYNRSLIVNNLDGSIRKQELTQADIKADIQHLLDEIRRSNSSEIMDMYEIKKLMFIWRQLSASASMKNCNQCIHKIH